MAAIMMRRASFLDSLFQSRSVFQLAKNRSDPGSPPPVPHPETDLAPVFSFLVGGSLCSPRRFLPRQHSSQSLKLTFNCLPFLNRKYGRTRKEAQGGLIGLACQVAGSICSRLIAKLSFCLGQLGESDSSAQIGLQKLRQGSLAFRDQLIKLLMIHDECSSKGAGMPVTKSMPDTLANQAAYPQTS